MSDPTASEVRTGCPYCGVGCGLVAQVRGGTLHAVRGDEHHPVNAGRTCAKPLGMVDASRSADRATVPLWRESADARWRETTWDEVMPAVARRMLDIRREHGPGSIAFYLSGQLLTEDYYVVSKLAKGFLGTNNVDSNSRLCMSSAVAGYDGAFGADGPPPAYEDIERADCFLLLGSNTAACHPILWGRVRERQAQGAFVIVVDPRRTDTAAAADLHLPIRPGTDLALLGAMLHVADRDGLVDRAYVERHTEGHERALRVAAKWTPERAAKVCGVPAEDIVAAAHRFAAAGGALAMWSMGANQQLIGTRINRAILNLCLATGQIGRPGAGPLSLTGQPNAMGGREVGGLAHLLPGYRKVADPEHRREMDELWALPPEAAGVSAEPGLPATDLFEALEDGRIRAVWICATNPVVSMPDAERTRAALGRAELVVVQDAYEPTETSALAHVLLPAAQWPEKQGTMTNSERRIGLVRRAIDPPGEARADWEIFAHLAAEMGFGEHFAWPSAAEVYDEFAALTAGRPCDQTGVSHARLEAEGTIQWPCSWPTHPGTPRLYDDGVFRTPSGRARMEPNESDDGAEPVDPRFPRVLTTGRVATQWHTMTRTAKTPSLLAAEPEPFLEIHPDDARAAGVREGERARIVSERGAAQARVRLDPTLSPGTVFAPFHWGALHAPAGTGTVNALTDRATDPVSRQPGLKASPVRVEPVLAPRRARRRSAEPRHLVVVGAGPAGVATVEHALAHAPEGAWRVTVLGREADAPYNRVALSDHLAGRRSLADLELHPPSWYAERGVDVRTGVSVADVDTARRVVVTEAGEELAYDALVLATGSQPLMPPIEGLDLPGVHPFRTTADARAILSAASSAKRAIVVGGGLLGIEAARGLAGQGVPVTLVHLVDRLMERQLDGPAARMLERALRGLGIDVLCDRATTHVLGTERAEGLRFAWGDDIEGDLVVVSAGIRPEVSLAERAGLEVGRGVLVDDALRTSVPGVWAVGECAQHRGVVQGLWAPILAQARAAGASIAGVPAATQGAVPATRLKVEEIDLFCVGAPGAEAILDDEIATMDTRGGIYRKLVVRGDRLLGAIVLGDTSDSARLTDLVASGAPAPADLLATGAMPVAEPDDSAVVCACNGVTRGDIVAAVRDGAESVDAIAETTRAATGCGGCRSAVAKLCAAVRAEDVKPGGVSGASG